MDNSRTPGITDDDASPSRRTWLVRAASLAAMAAAAPWLFDAPPASAQETAAGAARRNRLPPFDPYAAKAARGPSSRAVPAVGATPSVPGEPYIVPMARGWSAVSLLTAGNATPSGYVMTGVPDGLGAVGNGDGTITVFMNHELVPGRSVVRAHGSTGAFVSRWVIDTASLAVLDGADMVPSPGHQHLWAGNGWVTAAAVLAGLATTSYPSRADLDFDRLCSADLAAPGAYYDERSGRGYKGPILLNGEETEDRRGRAYAWVDETRSVYELPAFATGTYGAKDDPPPEWENLLASPHAGAKTVVIGNSDGGSSQIYVYIGDKRAEGSPIERAGLVDGRLYSLAVAGVKQESRTRNVGLAKALLGGGSSARVSLVPAGKGTAFLRPEDGAWHPTRPGVYLFTTTDRNNFASPDSVATGDKAHQVGRSRLWAVTFDDLAAIATDGTPTARIEMLLDGTEGGDMFDNITIDRDGIAYICEDTGKARHGNKVWSYDTRSGRLEAIARFDPALFGDVVAKAYTPPKAPFTDDKETSGILDVTELFAAAPWFRPGSTVLLVNVQAHFGYDGSQEMGRRIYEGGQLVLLVKAPGNG